MISVTKHTVLIRLLLCIITAIATPAYGRDVLIVMSRDHANYHKVVDTIQAYFVAPQHQFPSPITFSVLTLNNNGEVKIPTDISPSLVVGVGGRAIKSLRENWKTHPHIYTLISEKSLPVNREKNQNIKNPWSAVLLDQPIFRPFKVSEELLKYKGKRIGLLASESYKEQVNASLRAHPEIENSLQISWVKKSEDVVRKAKQLINTIDVLVALPDPTVWKAENAKWLLYLSYRKKVPVVGFSSSLLKAGALVSVYSKPEQIGQQTAEVIEQWALKKTWQGLHSPKYFTVEINDLVADGLRTPDEVKERILNMEKDSL